MTLVRRTLLALGIALATAAVVTGLVVVEAGRAPERFERLHRN